MCFSRKHNSASMGGAYSHPEIAQGTAIFSQKEEPGSSDTRFPLEGAEFDRLWGGGHFCKHLDARREEAYGV